MGGGVALLVKNSVSCRRIENSCFTPLEAIAIECFCDDDFSFILFNVYKPNVTDTHLLQPLFDALSFLRSLGKPLVVMGDFNLPDINWVSLTAPAINYQDKFLDCFNSNGLSQFVLEPTRGNNILDLVFSNDPNLLQNIRIGDAIANSDHNSISFEISTPPITSSPPSARLNWKKANLVNILCDLDLINWSIVFSKCNDIDELWHCFESACLKTIHEHVPLFSVRNPSRRKFLPNAIKNVLSQKRKYFRNRWDSQSSLSKYKKNG